jgi:hypothetical protein
MTQDQLNEILALIGKARRLVRIAQEAKHPLTYPQMQTFQRVIHMLHQSSAELFANFGVVEVMSVEEVAQIEAEYQASLKENTNG